MSALYFQVFRGCIVTANADGSIPINAKLVLEIADQGNKLSPAQVELAQILLDQANAFAVQKEPA